MDCWGEGVECYGHAAGVSVGAGLGGEGDGVLEEEAELDKELGSGEAEIVVVQMVEGLADEGVSGIRLGVGAGSEPGEGDCMSAQGHGEGVGVACVG